MFAFQSLTLCVSAVVPGDFTVFVRFVTGILCQASHGVLAKRGALMRTGRWRRAASNVLLGVALGLMSYYALTTFLGWLAQDRLRDASSKTPTFEVTDPEGLVRRGADALDFTGWAEQDRAYWASLSEGGVFGRLVIPRMGLDLLAVKGVSRADLRKGPGWIGWTSLPGPSGTCGISGHRTTYGAPFRRLNELMPGDTIDLFSPYRLYRYRVTKSLIVRPSQTEVVGPLGYPALALTACHPPFSAQYRLVVQAELVEVRRVVNLQK